LDARRQFYCGIEDGPNKKQSKQQINKFGKASDNWHPNVLRPNFAKRNFEIAWNSLGHAVRQAKLARYRR
jgi:hypothetical protein